MFSCPPGSLSVGEAMGLHISLPFERRHAERAHRAAAPGKVPRATLEFLGADGATLGPRLRPAIPEPTHFEVPGGHGAMAWDRPDPHLSVPVKAVPEGAAAVRAAFAGTMLAAAPLAAAAAPQPGPPAARQTFNPQGRWTLLLVSELFTAAKDFFDHALALDAYIRGQDPFSRPGVAAGLRTEALFWPSPPGGLFKVQHPDRRVWGDNDLVNRYLAKAKAKGRLTIVLVNLPARGGAGGGGGRPAWATITSEPGETWQAVALHEIGHAFGLADEYSEASGAVPEPNPLEPNVTREADPARTAWAALRTPGHPAVPTCAAATQPQGPAHVVGTFEGARYQATGRYRPTLECLMQRTDRPFCPVCADHIARALI